MLKIKTRKQLLSVFLSPAFLMLALSLLVLTIQILVIGRIRPFNSDDLYWQQVMRTWLPFNGETVYLGTKDIFIEQVPFFWFMESLFSPSRRLLLFETLVLTIFAFSAFYLTSLYFLKKLKIKPTYFILLPFVWLASFGYPLVQNYLNSDWRTFEVGISFLTFLLVAAILFKDFNPLKNIKTKILSLIATLYIGIVIYSDPYYIFFTIGPLVIFAACLFLLKKISRAQLYLIIGGTVLSFIFAKLTEFICEKAGLLIVSDTPSVFVNFDNILTNIVSSLHGLLIVFGADFFGRPATSPTTLGTMLNALILGIILYSAFKLRASLQKPVRSRLTLPQLWVLFFGLILGFIFAVYTSSTLVAVTNYRFFIIFIYCSVIFLAIVLARLNSTPNYLKPLLSCVFVGAILFNLYTTILTDNTSHQIDVAFNQGNSLNFDIIKAVESEGLTKGYASYWHSNVNTYLSGGNTTFLPTICDLQGKLGEFRWLIDGGQFNVQSDKTFYFLDPDIKAPSSCSLDQINEQFGKPDKIVHVRNKLLLIYDYDIASRILPFNKELL